MKSNIFCFLVLFLLIGNLSISAQNKTTSSSQIKRLISKKRSFNQNYGFGYRIQLYYGNETQARKLQSKFRIAYPKTYTKLAYEQPYWKVQVGQYKTKLKADKAVLEFSEKFPGLIVIPLGK